ncbi:Aldose 1-epimerase [Spironucleus salmonicida]|uniref:Aldose 1-epimerase n=1 Tax=Spironucleus salmonicida TaxID=348837 RepID=V6LMF6_9EUKA|nr:Aldose 1-epimerase [Spironucleus salmonicida]|eukprot:EST45815.1 Aldose 1-epimerase [Spironucleus salmonicida]
MQPFEKKQFTKKIDGKETSLYTIKSEALTATITNYGGIIVQLLFKGKDLILGYDTIQKYIDSSEKYFGAIVGPVCNRICPAETKIDGKMVVFKKAEYLLHSDALLSTKVWDTKLVSEHKIILTTSLNGELGFPGNVKYTVTYSVKDGIFRTDITAFTDRKTILNCTSHPFFNFGTGQVLQHQLKINAQQYLRVSENCVSVEPEDVKNTPFDFKKMKQIGQNIHEENEQLKRGIGYDHCFVVTPDCEQAVLQFEDVKMIIKSNQKGMQLYSGNWLSGFKGKYGRAYDERTAVCLETQGWPNACNEEKFPSIEVGAMQEYQNWTEYQFL